MYDKTVSDIWNISLSDLIEINDHLLESLGKQKVLKSHSLEFEERLTVHAKRILSAINVMHMLGVPAGSKSSFITTKWSSELTNDSVTKLIKANSSLDWVRINRNDVLA